MLGMVEVGDRLGLVAEPPHLVVAGPVPGPDHLEGDEAVEAELPGLVDDAHAAAAQDAEQLVVAEVADLGALARSAPLPLVERSSPRSRSRRLPRPGLPTSPGRPASWILGSAGSRGARCISRQRRGPFQTLPWRVAAATGRRGSTMRSKRSCSSKYSARSEARSGCCCRRAWRSGASPASIAAK